MSGEERRGVLCICGPTASGKSEAAALVAEDVDGEIVNADSRQVYRGLAIGTGAPPDELLRRVPHHLFGFVDPCERYSAGAYVRDAIAAIDGIRSRGRLPIIVGGTGFYIEALGGTMPMDRAVADDDVRNRVRRETQLHPHEFLHGWLGVIAPGAAGRVAPGDRYRTMRALETALMLRAEDAEQRPAVGGAGRHVVMRIALLDVDVDVLRLRIGARVRAMYERGLVDEALAVERRCAGAPALTGLGYAEALAWHHGRATREEAVTATIARTVRYAKRQRTWFRRMHAAVPVAASDDRVAAAVIAGLARETVRST